MSQPAADTRAAAASQAQGQAQVQAQVQAPAQGTAKANPSLAAALAPAPAPKSFDYVMRSLLAGGVAGCIAKSAIAPLDRVKILFQGTHHHFRPYIGSVRGAFQACAHIWRTEGLIGLYRGHGAMLARIFPYSALNYFCFEQYKRVLLPADPHTKPVPGVRLLCGSLAGATSVLFTYPLDLARARLAYQVTDRTHSGMLHSMQLTWQREGVKGLFRGFGPTVTGILPYAGTSFYTFDTLKIALLTRWPDATSDGRGHLTVPFKLLAGGLAGIAAQTVSYPLDVIRRRMQLSGFSSEAPKHAYRSTLHAAQQIVRTEGVRTLFVGLSINFLKHPPAMAISFTAYEWAKAKFAIEADAAGGGGH